MTVLRKLGAANTKGGRRLGHGMLEDGLPNNFPAGLKVLVVDDDLTCLVILKRMLKNCGYQVATCSLATEALSMLRDGENTFDLVLSDVHMPDMDGFKLLERIGLEMDIPVIMMSADRRTEMVMRGVKHGACDYLIKPIRSEELKIIWQHVVRKRRPEKELEHSSSVKDSESSVNKANDSEWNSQGKKRQAVEEEVDCGHESDEPSPLKKPRAVWTVELHQQFVNAVHQLGVDQAVPERIIKLMDAPRLTSEDVASHLEKFSLYIRRLPSVAQQLQAGPVDQMGKVGPVNNRDQPSQFYSQTLSGFQAEALGQAPLLTNPVMPAVDRSALLRAPLPGGGFAAWLPPCELPVDQMGPTPMVNGMQVNELTSGFQKRSSDNNGYLFNGDDLMMRFQGNPGAPLPGGGFAGWVPPCELPVDQMGPTPMVNGMQNVMVPEPMGYGHVGQHGGGYMGHVAASGFPAQPAWVPSRFGGDEFELQANGMNQQPVGGPVQPSSAQPDGVQPR